ncbi:MAG: hypothetical protein HQM09_16250 [Candidatus Riflebacteria bacterium]|nr:hypothetical protein [Candidatus Riflebacteria bacterium]
MDDIAFFKTLVTTLQGHLTIDSNRIFAVGMSNGAMMSYTLAAEMSNVFAAVSPIAGTVGGQPQATAPLWLPPAPLNPVSIMAFHGKLDDNVPYLGGEGGDSLDKGRVDQNVMDSISFWLQADGIIAPPKEAVSASHNIVTDTFTGGKNGTEVVLVTINNGGHSWPGVSTFEKPAADAMEINATQMSWQFFKSHPKVIGTTKTNAADGGM